MRRCAAKPYEGPGEFIFVSYCHQDRAYVFPIIEQLVRDGYRVWYDEGIDPGSEWPEIIASHLNACALCIAFITENSMNSHNCRREINFALLKKKYLISVLLEPVQMSIGMEMQLSAVRAIYKYKFDSHEEFLRSLIDVKAFDRCMGQPDHSVVVSSPDDYVNDFDESIPRDPFSYKWFASGGNLTEEEERRRVEAEAKRKAEEEEARRRAEEEEARRRAEEEEARRRAEEEEAKRRAEEEEARRRAEEEEAKRRAEEEEAKRKAEEEEARRRAEEEEARRRAEEEEAKRREHSLRRVKTDEIIAVRKSSFTIGRSAEYADYVIAKKTISRIHATLNTTADGCYIVDNGSLNKTYLNEKYLQPGIKYLLRAGDLIRLYDEKFIFLA